MPTVESIVEMCAVRGHETLIVEPGLVGPVPFAVTPVFSLEEFATYPRGPATVFLAVLECPTHSFITLRAVDSLNSSIAASSPFLFLMANAILKQQTLFFRIGCA